MNVSTILDHIDSGHMALPEFQRGYVWNREQVRGLMQSLYRKHPVGGLLVWVTQSDEANFRGDGPVAPGVVKLLLDGQQRITSLYGIIRGKAPRFFDGNSEVFTGLHFHLGTEEFSFYQPLKMQGDPLWIDVSRLMLEGLGPLIGTLTSVPQLQPNLSEYLGRLSQLHSIQGIGLHVEEVTGADKTIDVVVDIFNRVNSGGTKLSKGDLALAKICAELPPARERMKGALKRWNAAGFNFDLDWLLRNVNTVTTGEAKFGAMHDLDAASFAAGLERAEKAIDDILLMISGRLGLDHDRVFFGRFALPVMTHYLDRRGGKKNLDEVERDQLLFWYLQSALWGRFSGANESFIDKDLSVIEDLQGGLDRLIGELRLWRGGLRVDPAHFSGWSLGARFYPMLYLLTRVKGARDWGFGGELKSTVLGKMNQLEVHHIFPKAKLYENNYDRSEVNAVANFCFQTKDTNLWISDRLPENYFPEVEKKHPGALASQWIPSDPELWRVKNYPAFLEARKRLLAEAANAFLTELYHRDATDLEAEQPLSVVPAAISSVKLDSGVVGSDREEILIQETNRWVIEQGLPEGDYCYEVTDSETGTSLAIFDLAWPSGMQAGFSQPVALLIGEEPDIHALANERGYRYFTSVDALKEYVAREVLGAK